MKSANTFRWRQALIVFLMANVKIADARLYHAKKMGRNCVVGK